MNESKYLNQLFLLGKVTLVILILGDLLRKIALALHLEFNKYTAATKIFLVLFYFIFLLLNLKHYIKHKTSRTLLLLIVSLIALFALSNISPLNKDGFNPKNLEYLVRYLFFPLTFFLFFSLFKDSKRVYKLFRFYEWFFLINLGLIIISFLFDLSFFKSYPNPNRFGFSGVINRTNQMSYITILFILIYYYKYAHLKVKNNFKLVLILLASLLIGTKKIYFFLILLCIYHLYYFRKTILKKALISLTLVTLFVLIFKNKLIEIFKTKFGIFIDIYENNGLLASLMSYRNETLSKTYETLIQSKWHFYNIFIGGADYTIIRPEMDLIDVFFFFGALGLLIYFLLINFFIKTINKMNTYLLLSLLLIFAISFLTSGFLISVNIPFVFFISLYYLNSLTKESNAEFIE